MNFIDDKLAVYSENHSDNESELLKKLNRETHLKIAKPRMLSGHLQGRFLSMISNMINPKYILEIGTYTGYSALCLAEGLQKDGKLITIDINEELLEFTQKYFSESKYNTQITPIIGAALNIIPALEHVFDLVFIDADKINYYNYFEAVLPKIRTGGFILVDNVLWSGKVIIEKDTKIDKDTQNMIDFNLKIAIDDRIEKVLLPIRDGLTLIRKK